MIRMKMNIRKAGLSDVKTIDRFQHQIGLHERNIDPSFRRKDKILTSQKEIRRKIRSRNCLFLIAEADGKAVGCGSGEISKNKGTWSRYKYKGFIGTMYVKDEYRRRGIAGKIIEELLKWFRRKGIKDIRLQVYQNNEPAVRAYRKHGFKDCIVEMRHGGVKRQAISCMGRHYIYKLKNPFAAL